MMMFFPGPGGKTSVMSDRKVELGFSQNFRNQVERLRRKYPHIAADLGPLFQQIRNGETPGDKIPGVGFSVYKARAANSDANRGKSGGYRVIYYLRTANRTYIIGVYTKSEIENMGASAIRALVRDVEAEMKGQKPD